MRILILDFFHAVIQHNKMRHSILSITNSQGMKLVDQIDIQNELVSFYNQLLGVSSPCQPLDMHILGRGPIVTEDHCINLCRPVSHDEIKIALFQINPHKCPGPDGFNSTFYKATWEIIGQDIVSAVSNFFHTGNMLKSLNSTSIVLIPKVPCPNTAAEFRPIACCNILYKCISNILTNRLRTILPLIISENQGAFVKGRSIVHNVLLAQEMVHMYSRKNVSPRCTLKIDLRKAYDTINWDFLDGVLLGLGFPHKFRNWIMQCVTTASYSIIVNGQHSTQFQGRRGIRQGDPISPYLFVLAMKYLSRSLADLDGNDKFRYHPKCKRSKITHLCFADDLMLFCRGDFDSVEQLFLKFSHFSQVSGLCVNVSKSQAFFGGVPINTRQQIIQLLQFVEGVLPVKYLGIPLSSKGPTSSDGGILIERIMARIKCWTTRFLTYAGRLQLIKSVIYSIHAYWGSIFLLPKMVINSVEQLCRDFLWTGTYGVHSCVMITSY